MECIVTNKKSERKKQLDDQLKILPQSYCTDEQMSPTVKKFYKSYKTYPIDFQNCPPRNKIFVISDDCKNFKLSIKDPMSVPNIVELNNKMNKCIASKDQSCPYIGSQLINCCNEKYQTDINTLGLNDIMNDAYDKCIKSYGQCGIYSINDVKYQQDNLFKRIGYWYIFVLILTLLFALLNIGLYWFKK